MPGKLVVIYSGSKCHELNSPVDLPVYKYLVDHRIVQVVCRQCIDAETVTLKLKAYELQTWYTDGARRPASATSAMTYKVEGQGCTVT